ncbi:plastocyanin/azurin family copper-binding protein (plasmid) [Haladaptatus sp. SPP-AMP-3]|uniref:plastocyanin/azurin family copper-binding protein n=1 Tax=Haladaptatus sp. SPP-AMP-3 TaxID=3121295 RepID=UPI003C2F60E7
MPEHTQSRTTNDDVTSGTGGSSMHRRAFLTGVAATATATGSTAIVRGQNGGGSTHVIGMYQDSEGYYFDPIGLHVKPGDTVKWACKSGAHSATSYSKGNPKVNNVLIPKGADGWNSGILQPGQSFTHTFTTKGTYDYYCIPHKTLGMVARIVCGEPGGPAESGSIPSSDEPQSGVMPPSKAIVKENSISFPYIPNEGHGGPPALFWGGLGIFSLTSVYLFSVYDRKTGRYDDTSETEFEVPDRAEADESAEE